MVDVVFRQDLTNAGVFGFTGLSGNASGIGEHRYHLDASGLVSPYGHTMPTIIADLLDIAASVMWADRNCKRPRKYGNFMPLRGWVRQFELTLGVRNPEIWNDPRTKEIVTRILTWLTEDTWILQFQRQKEVKGEYRQESLFSSPPTDALIVLYSGGLDSLAGTVTFLQENPNRNVVLMSAVSHRLSGVVREQVRRLQSKFSVNRIQHALMPFHVNHDEQDKEESTQRTRGFLFLSFGIAEAIACNASRIVTCENGIGMLNLPLNRHQLGTQNTRAVHPKTLLLMNSLLTHLGFDHIRCGAPYILKTKSELCAHISESNVSSLCRTTVSCDSFPLRETRPDGYTDAQLHCGWCTSCLFRRQALFAAGLQIEDAATPYQYDVCKSLPTKLGSRLERLKFLLDQKQVLQQALLSPLPDAALMIEFPELVTVYQTIEQCPDLFDLTSATNFMEDVSQLFRRYVGEWQKFPFQLHTR
jgi:7-cyano-7-deazaguanine synthase in queuosine biosynthesis